MMTLHRQKVQDVSMSLLSPIHSPEFWIRFRKHELAKAIRLRVQRILEHSKFHTSEDNNNNNNNNSNVAAVLGRNHMVIGDLLGEGAFSQVSQVETMARKMQQNEATLSQSYVIKQLQPDMLDGKKVPMKDYQQIATDLIMEAAYLSKLRHPNIVRVQGVSPAIHSCCSGTTTATCTTTTNKTTKRKEASSFGDAENDYYFVMECVHETLDQRIIEWNEQVRDPADRTALLRLQCNYGLQLAQVLTFLHQKRIIHRDLKPTNVGVTVVKDTQTIKLFDFGACRELPPARPWDAATDSRRTGRTTKSSCSHHYYQHGSSYHEQVFHMSMIGTPRYLAPEVLKTRLYNAKCDVYSWAILMAHMLTLTEPFGGYSPSEHMLRVVWQRERPELAVLQLPHSLEEMIRHAWEEELYVRPTMQQVLVNLESIINNEL